MTGGRILLLAGILYVLACGTTFCVGAPGLLPIP